jgi:hypothetical protein
MRARSLILIAFVLGGAGCARSTEDRLIGIWSLDRRGTRIPEMPFPGVEERIRSSVNNVKLKLLSDHTFVLTSPGIIEGKWSYHDGTVEFAPKNQARSFLFGEGGFKAKVGEDTQSMTVTQDTMAGTVTLRLQKTG